MSMSCDNDYTRRLQERRDRKRYPPLRFTPYQTKRQDSSGDAVGDEEANGRQTKRQEASGDVVGREEANDRQKELEKEETVKKVVKWVDECDEPPPLPWKEDAPPCPIHQRYGLTTKEVDTRYGKAQLHKCPHPECFISCFGTEEQRDRFLHQVSYSLHWQFRDPHCPMVCYCGNMLSLKMSHSEKNPDRLFLTCRQREGGCKMFMWSDDMAPAEVRQHWDWYMSK